MPLYLVKEELLRQDLANVWSRQPRVTRESFSYNPGSLSPNMLPKILVINWFPLFYKDQTGTLTYIMAILPFKVAFWL